VRDEDVRSSCFQHLAILCARFGEDVPYRGGLDSGFPFRGLRVPYLNYQKGIYRARVQRGPAALAIQTSYASPYADHATPDGYLYDYRAGPGGGRDNAALRSAFQLQVPIVHFVGTRPGWYRPVYPCYIAEDDTVARRVLVSPGAMVGPLDDREPAPYDDEAERRYAVRSVRVRMHQARFRGRVLPAYRSQCAVCRLKEVRLLDAAHITGDLAEGGEPAISNGLSLCSIHHRAFDGDLVCVSPDYEVAVSARLLEDEDGPMLDLLKAFHGTTIELPSSPRLRPDRERLAARFERFLATSGA
jgi:putative restriction endonuclease